MTERTPREWPLHAYLGMLLAITSVLTFLIVGSGFLVTRIPQLESEIRTRAEGDARELAFRIELQMLALQEQLALVATALLNSEAPGALISQAVVGGKVFRALYLLSPQGEVIVAGLTPEYRQLEREVLGSDLSATPLFREVKQRSGAVWSDKYLSSLSGVVTVGLAVPVSGERVLLAEIPLAYLLNILDQNPAEKKRAIWVIDQRGEILADELAVRHIDRDPHDAESRIAPGGDLATGLAQHPAADAHDVQQLCGRRIKVHHIARILGCLCSRIHGDSDIGLSESRSIIGSVSRHGDQVPSGLLVANAF